MRTHPASPDPAQGCSRQSPSGDPAETRPAPDLVHPGAGRPRSPHSGMQSLLRMCVCSCVCVFIRMSLFKKQPRLRGSWTLHVRVSPKPLAHYPSPQGPASHSTPLSASIAVPCREKDYGKLQTPPTVPSACQLGLPACLPKSPRYLIPISFPHFNRREERFQTTPGFVVLPHALGFAASLLWRRMPSSIQARPVSPSSTLLPVTVFIHNMFWNLPTHPRLFP